MSMIDDFVRSVRQQTLVVGYSSDHDPHVTAFVWLLNVPHGELRRVQRAALAQAIDLHGNAPLTFIVGAASPDKTKALLAGSNATNAAVVATPARGTHAVFASRGWQRGGSSSTAVCAKSRVPRTARTSTIPVELV